MEPSLRDRLTAILIDAKLLTSEDLAKAVKVQKERGGSLSEILVGLKMVSKDDLMMALSQGLGVPPINLAHYKIDPAILKSVSPKIALHYQIIPVSKIGEILTVAMADPLNIFAIDDIKALTGLKIAPLITTENDIRETLQRYYEEDATQAMDRIVGDIQAGQIKMVEGSAAAPETSQELIRMTEHAPVVKLTNALLAEGVHLKASDILLEPLEARMRVRYRIDGILHEGTSPPRNVHNGVVSRLKVMSELDIAERRLPQDGRFKVRLQGREVDFRISVLPSHDGEKVALRILDKSQAMLDLDRLGFDEASIAELKKAGERPHGMILVSGPTGCGKTTTLYALLKYVDSPTDNIITVEDPVEYLLDGINQVTARPEIGLTFALALRSILRQDPDVVMIGEIRDRETVDIAIKAALTGHLVLSTLHTTTASGSIIRLLDMGVEPFLITSALVLVAAQRLVRKICTSCKETQRPSKELFDASGVKGTFYHGRGCDACLETGYKGRVGLIEVLSLTPKIKEMILKGAQEHEIRAEAKREGMGGLRENGIRKAIEGVTTLDEVFRVTVGDQDVETKW